MDQETEPKTVVVIAEGEPSTGTMCTMDFETGEKKSVVVVTAGGDFTVSTIGPTDRHSVIPNGAGPSPTALDRANPVDHPPHYQTAAGLEAIDVIEAACGTAGHLPTAIKYILRHQRKGRPAEDLRKAVWYVRRVLACPILPPAGPWHSNNYTARVADAFGLSGAARDALGHVLVGATATLEDWPRTTASQIDINRRRREALTAAVAALEQAAAEIEAEGRP